MDSSAAVNASAEPRSTSGTGSTAATWAPGPAGVALYEEHPDRLQRLARRNLWMHFTRMGSYDEHHACPVIVRGEGCYVYDEHGKRYLDGALGAVLRERRPRPRRARRRRRGAGARSSASTRTGATPTRRRSSSRRASRSSRPGNLNRVFFTSGGSEAVESAWKLAKAYHHARGRAQTRHKLISRKLAYHGTSMGALTGDRPDAAARPRSNR